MLNIGVIGVGYLGQHHARIFSQLENVRLVGVADIDEKRAIEIAQRHKCTPYKDYREIFKKVDALSIVTPTITHFQTALECINAGKDIFIEKPITSTTEEAERLIEESEKRGIIIQVGHIERFNPAVIKLNSIIDKPAFFEAERLSPFMGRGIDVDIIIDLMIHDIDVILSIIESTGKKAMVKDIKAVGSKVLTNRIDVAKVWIDFGNDIHALLTAGRLSSEKSRLLKVFQKNSHFILDYQNMQITKLFKIDEKIQREIIDVEKKEPLKEELMHFIDCITKRHNPIVTAFDGMKALEITHKIIKEGILI